MSDDAQSEASVAASLVSFASTLGPRLGDVSQSSLKQMRVLCLTAIACTMEGRYLRPNTGHSLLRACGCNSAYEREMEDMITAMMSGLGRSSGNLRYLACVLLEALYKAGVELMNRRHVEGAKKKNPDVLVGVEAVWEVFGNIPDPRRRKSTRTEEMGRHEDILWFEATPIISAIALLFSRGGVRYPDESPPGPEQERHVRSLCKHTLANLKTFDAKEHLKYVGRQVAKRATLLEEAARVQSESDQAAIDPELKAALAGTPAETVKPRPADVSGKKQPSKKKDDDDWGAESGSGFDDDGEFDSSFFDPVQETSTGDEGAVCQTAVQDLVLRFKQYEKKAEKRDLALDALSLIVPELLKARKKNRAEHDDESDDERSPSQLKSRIKFILEAWRQRGMSAELIKVAKEILICLPSTKENNLVATIARALALMKAPWEDRELVLFIRTLEFDGLHDLNKARLLALRGAGGDDHAGYAAALRELRRKIDCRTEICPHEHYTQHCVLAELVAVWMVCEKDCYGLRTCDWSGICKRGVTQLPNITNAALRGFGDEELRSTFNRLAQEAARTSSLVVGYRTTEGITIEDFLCGATFMHRSRVAELVEEAKVASEEAASARKKKSEKPQEEKGATSKGETMSRGELLRQFSFLLKSSCPRMLHRRCFKCGEEGHEGTKCKADIGKMHRDYPLLEAAPVLLPYLVASGLITQVPQRA